MNLVIVTTNRGVPFLSVLLLLFMAFPLQPARADQASYQFGVFPHLAAGQIENVFAPMAADLSRAIGRTVGLKTKPTFEAFMEELDGQVYDIAFVQPFDYVWAHDKHGYIPLARRGEPLTGLIVVKTDSPLRSLGELKGKKIGLPPEVAAVSHLTKMALLQAEIDPRTDIKLQYYKAHDSCLQQLLIGGIDACGTTAYTLRFFKNKWDVKPEYWRKPKPYRIRCLLFIRVSASKHARRS